MVSPPIGGEADAMQPTDVVQLWSAPDSTHLDPLRPLTPRALSPGPIAPRHLLQSHLPASCTGVNPVTIPLNDTLRGLMCGPEDKEFQLELWHGESRTTADSALYHILASPI